MIETVLLGIIIPKVKGYKLKPLLKCWPLYPIIIFEGLYLFFQVNIFSGNYEYVHLSNTFKYFYLYVFLIPIFKYRLYLQGFIGSIFIFIGTYCNNMAMYLNDGKMHVFPTLSYYTGYLKSNTFNLLINDFHVLGNSETNAKILTDFIDVGYSVWSIGDVFIRIFAFMIIYSTIKVINSELI